MDCILNHITDVVVEGHEGGTGMLVLQGLCILGVKVNDCSTYHNSEVILKELHDILGGGEVAASYGSSYGGYISGLEDNAFAKRRLCCIFADVGGTIDSDFSGFNVIHLVIVAELPFKHILVGAGGVGEV